jgi:hypothetical protein
MLKAKETFHHDGGTVLAGEEYGDRDEVVKGREHLFEKASRKAKASTDEGDDSSDA